MVIVNKRTKDGYEVVLFKEKDEVSDRPTKSDRNIKQRRESKKMTVRTDDRKNQWP